MFTLPQIVSRAFLVTVCGVLPALESAAQEADLDAGLQNAKAGLVACMRPNNDLRRCNALVRFQIQGDSVKVFAEVTMSDVPPVVMSTTYDAQVRAAAICSGATADDVMHATFVIAGNAATERQTQDIRAQLIRNLAARAPGEDCVTFERSGEWFARVVFGGTRRPDMDEPVIWLPVNHSYVVGP